jgi:LacI family transcriptional regulator
MATLKDIAADAGVAVGTVSKVLNTGTELDRISPVCIERVRASARRLGYVPNYHAQSMRTGRAQCIGVALDVPSDDAVMGNSYFARLFGGIQRGASKCGFSVHLVSSTEGQSAAEKGVERVRRGQIDGLVVLGLLASYRNRPWPREQTNIPAVTIRPQQDSPLPSIDLDERAGMRKVAEHLAGLGHQMLLWLGPTEERYEFLADASVQCGLQVAICGGGTKHARWPEILSRYLHSAHPPFTALVCWNDWIAVNAYTVLAHAGLHVPGDVSVVGFDDLHAVAMWPPLTTVRHMLFEMGVAAAEQVCEMIERGEKASDRSGQRTVIEPELKVRGSTAHPKGIITT